jgi:(S)-ureidoglycine aminohydrolase
MRQQNELLGSRTRVKERYALIPIEGVPYSRLPEWPDARVQVLASPALGAGFAQYRLECDPGTTGRRIADGEIEHFLFVLDGSVELTVTDGVSDQGVETSASHELSTGGFALLPPHASYTTHAAEGAGATLLLLRKRYEPADGIPPYDPLVSREQDVPGEVYMGDGGALLQTLIPDEFSYDMAMNIFTFETGHSLPVTETHVMEHGLWVLQGKGLYYLDDTWMEVEKSDFIWMGPFCPQSYYATGPSPTRYLYYKNVNREIPL